MKTKVNERSRSAEMRSLSKVVAERSRSAEMWSLSGAEMTLFSFDRRELLKTPFSRHCERSEAIQSTGYQWIASGYRPRNDVGGRFLEVPRKVPLIIVPVTIFRHFDGFDISTFRQAQ